MKRVEDSSSSPDDRLESLDKRLKEKQANHAEPPSGAAIAYRMGTELVAGVAVGTGFGYYLDKALGTLPIFLVVFLFVGAAAGVKMMMDTSNRYNDRLADESEPNEE
jgi:ATP synthase protein I